MVPGITSLWAPGITSLWAPGAVWPTATAMIRVVERAGDGAALVAEEDAPEDAAVVFDAIRTVRPRHQGRRTVVVAFEYRFTIGGHARVSRSAIVGTPRGWALGLGHGAGGQY